MTPNSATEYETLMTQPVEEMVKSLLWPGDSQWRIYYHRMCGQLSTAWSNLLKLESTSTEDLLKLELLVGVDHNRLQTMAPETVVQIDWSRSPHLWAVPPDRFVHSTNWCSSATAGIRSCNLQHARQPLCLCGHSGYKWTSRELYQRGFIYRGA